MILPNPGEEVVEPEPTLPRSQGHHREWLDKIKTRDVCSCNFRYGHELSSAIGHLGNIALRTGRALAWDAEAGRVHQRRGGQRLPAAARVPQALDLAGGLRPGPDGHRSRLESRGSWSNTSRDLEPRIPAHRGGWPLHSPARAVLIVRTGTILAAPSRRHLSRAAVRGPVVDLHKEAP